MTIAIILAGGTGSRIKSDIPKQFIELSGQMMIMHALAPFGESDMIDNIQIVADENWREKIEDAIFEDPESAVAEKFLGFSDPGGNRQMSIYNAMKDLKKLFECATINDDSANISADTRENANCSKFMVHSKFKVIDNIIIHDAARPFVSVENIDECITVLDTHEGAMPVLPMKDTIYYGSADGSKIEKLLDRDRLFAGQAPEAFRLGLYRDAILRLSDDQTDKLRGTTEPAIMAGLDVVMVDGEESNFKITTPSDLERFEKTIEEHK